MKNEENDKRSVARDDSSGNRNPAKRSLYFQHTITFSSLNRTGSGIIDQICKLMDVEHLTLGGNSVIRYTNDIYAGTIEFFRPFQVKDGSKFIPLPKSNFQVKVTARKEGAMFDMNKGESLAFSNVCCFENGHSVALLALVEEMQRIHMPYIKVEKTKLKQWIYSVPVDMAELNQDEITLAGEVEFYIYHAMWLARNS